MSWPPCLQPIADTLVKEVAKPAKDSMTEVVRSGDFLSYTAGATVCAGCLQSSHGA